MRGYSYNGLDYLKCVLMIIVVLCHVVNFRHLYPSVQLALVGMVMPAFLVVTGYLVNVEKDAGHFLLYIMRLALPYAIMSTCYAAAMAWLGGGDVAQVTSLAAWTNMLLADPIGPYWFFHTMIICALLYYVSARLLFRKDKAAAFFVLAALLVVVSMCVELVWTRFALSFFVGVGVRLFCNGFSCFFKPSVYAVFPLVALLLSSGPSGWDNLMVVLIAVCFICFYLKLADAWPKDAALVKVAGYIGRNTLPVYIFHPVFTMAGKYLLPLFGFDPTGLLHALVTVIMCVAGSLAVAYAMDKLRLSYCFGRRRILR